MRVDIFTTRHLGHRDLFVGAEKMIQETFLTHLFFGSTISLSPIIGALSAIPVKKYLLVLLNPVTSAKKKYLSSQRSNAELI